MVEVWTRKIPYQSEMEKRVSRSLLVSKIIKGLRPSVDQFCPDDYSSVVNWCLNENEDDRPKAKEVVDKLESMMAKLDGFETDHSRMF